MSKQVLIADDNSVVRHIIKSFLTLLREDLAICGEAVNGLEAVEKAKILKPDLVLLDLAMPEMNGAETAYVMKKALPEVPIILFTMYSEDIGRYLTSAVGVEVVLSKQDGLTKLAEAVEDILGLPPQ